MNFKPLRETDPSDPSLNTIMAEEGYLFLRGGLNIEKVLNFRNEFISILQKYNILKSDNSEPIWTGVNPDRDAGYNILDEGSEAKSMYELANMEEILRIAKAILGESPYIFPEMIPRFQPPNDPVFLTLSHQDRYFFEDSIEFYAAWTPLMDMDESVGGLTLAENSHKWEFDKGKYAFNPLLAAPGIPDDRMGDATWLRSDYHIGDLLIFESTMIHKALPNSSDRVRLSADTRYQRRDDPMDWKTRNRLKDNNYFVNNVMRSIVTASGLTGEAAERVVWESQHGIGTNEDIVAIEERIEKALKEAKGN